jgi:hypothetical protein
MRKIAITEFTRCPGWAEDGFSVSPQDLSLGGAGKQDSGGQKKAGQHITFVEESAHGTLRVYNYFTPPKSLA